MTDESPQQFFRRDDTKKAIERLAGERRLTLVVGAGASAELGIPLWSDLVERLLLRALSPDTPRDTAEYPDPVKVAARHALTQGGYLGAATMARAVLADRFKDELRFCLYDWPHRWQWNHPGSTARAIARLVRVMSEKGESCEVATTNYDLTLESAMSEALGTDVQPHYSESEPRDERQVVRHLHGTLSPDGDDHEIKLTEADYEASDREGLPWQEAYLRRRFDDSTVLFIGASLTDQQLLRYLFRYGKDDPRSVALLVRPTTQGDPVDERPSTDAAGKLFESLERERWEYVHLTALRADFPAQPAQLLHEVAHHKQSESATRYGERLDNWYRAACNKPLGLSSPEGFAATQTELQGVVSGWVEDVVNFLEEAGYDLSEETLAVHLWSRSPDRLYHGSRPDEFEKAGLSSVAMVGCSDRSWHDPRAIDARPITQPSSRAAVDALCWGTPQVQFPPGRPKWHWILATPVVLSEDDKRFGRLPVGAVTLVSDRDLEDSVLGSLQADQPGLLAVIERFLAWAAAVALTPGDASD